MLADWVETLHGVQPLLGPAVVDKVCQQSAHGLRPAAVQDGQLRRVDQGLAQHHVERAVDDTQPPARLGLNQV